MKRTMSRVVITFFILLIWASVKDCTKVKLYEGIDVNNVTIV
ncbi:hypothetical protein [Clostridium saccharobutylicum]|nr:hypothetical protein [Clostridium saccharobutylicum]MBA2903883.1 hypothetical protein [Clostridium saccharobutylicum]MBA8788754.1 hypothetical protein [Clostridium saccharobutylicum]MBA8895150.1 hypothetical protein [Clostridium saccharobutylicum]MBA8982042.1 hypothetical protein [Clostridium saccharobutylicum]MBA8992967.1 hypothetical protein [Clostridium saccharobutylicum]